MSKPPSPNRADGRGAGGRFAKGNPGGPGNPFARRVARLRSLLLDAVSDDDLQAIAAKLVERAKAGDLAAAREVLTRTIGKPIDAIDPDRDFDEEDAARRQHKDLMALLSPPSPGGG